MNHPSPKLNVPPQTAAVIDACIQALAALPELLDEMNDSLSILAAYAKERGIADGLFTKEMFEEPKEGGDGTGDATV